MTEKPFAFLSFLSPEVLTDFLADAQNSGLLRFWCFINHLPEEDEKKPHSHCFCDPAKRVDSVGLVAKFKEFDPKFPLKPRACLSPSYSKFGDFYFYNLHDKKYLKMKGQERKYHYKQENFISSNPEEMEYRVREIDLSEVFRKSLSSDLVSGRLPLIEAINTGQIAPHQLYAVVKGLEEVRQAVPAFDMTYKSLQKSRSGSPSDSGISSEIIDPETGEVAST